MKFCLLILTLCYSVCSFCQITQLNIDAVLPNEGGDFELLPGVSLEISPDNSIDDKISYHYYEFVREATEKEIVKPNRVPEGRFLFDDKIFSLGNIESFGFFLDTGKQELNYIPISGLLPYGLRPISIDSLKNKHLNLVQATEAYFVFELKKQRVVCYYGGSSFQRKSLFQKVLDSDEMRRRCESAMKFIGLEILLDQNEKKRIRGVVDTILIKPYETIIVLRRAEYLVSNYSFFYNTHIAAVLYKEYIKEVEDAELRYDKEVREKLSTNSKRKYIQGPRGGCYYINSNGNKVYVDRSLCH